MRGHVDRQQTMFVAFDLEQRIPADYPLRPIKRWCDRILATMGRDFRAAYGTTGRVGIPSEQRLCEASKYNLLYRWFIDRPLDEPM